eukprot:1326010-Amorphochlora_amoeboformis.AAC.2
MSLIIGTSPGHTGMRAAFRHLRVPRRTLRGRMATPSPYLPMYRVEYISRHEWRAFSSEKKDDEAEKIDKSDDTKETSVAESTTGTDLDLGDREPGAFGMPAPKDEVDEEIEKMM